MALGLHNFSNITRTSCTITISSLIPLQRVLHSDLDFSLMDFSPEASNSASEVFTISEDLVQLPSRKDAGNSVIDFDGLLSPPLKLHEDLAKGCGGQLWPAGMVLARYLLQQKREQLDGKTMFVCPSSFES